MFDGVRGVFAASARPVCWWMETSCVQPARTGTRETGVSCEYILLQNFIVTRYLFPHLCSQCAFGSYI